MILIKNAKVSWAGSWRRVNILINDEGKIVKLFRSSKANRYLISKVDKIYNAEENLALPGIVDMHVHFREPGYEYKEDFTSGSKAALAGGVTVVADMPNNKPRINSLDAFINKLNAIKNKSYVDFMLYVEISKDVTKLSEFLKHKDFLPAGVKVYMYEREEEQAFLNDVLPKEFVYVIHAEDSELISEDFDCNSYSSFESSRPRTAELRAIKKALEVARKGIRVHITHVSTLEGLLEIDKAKREGLKVTSDVTLHHLFFTKKHGEVLKSILKCFPPLREELDRRALISALKKDLIDCIITDHAPHAPFEKDKDLCRAPAGIASIEYFYPLLFKLFKIANFDDFNILVKAVTEKPARILSIPDRGKIRTGFYADIVIFDKKIRWRALREDAFSKAKLMPWENMRFRGKVVSVFLRGKLVYENESFIERNGMFWNRYL